MAKVRQVGGNKIIAGDLKGIDYIETVGEGTTSATGICIQHFNSAGNPIKVWLKDDLSVWTSDQLGDNLKKIHQGEGL